MQHCPACRKEISWPSPDGNTGSSKARCSNCGTGVTAQMQHCPACRKEISWARATAGTSARNGSVCSHCGVAVNATLTHCRSCGRRIDWSPTPRSLIRNPSITSSTLMTGARQKTIAVLIAILGGPWTWAYTYKRDSMKFWLGLSVPIALSTVSGFLIAVSPSTGTLVIFLVTLSMIFIVWAVSIVLALVRPANWYRNY